MKTFHAATVSSVALTLMLATPLVVAEQQRAQPGMGAQTGMQTSGMMGQSVDISDLKGKQLVDASNRNLGKIDEIVREKNSDKHFVVVTLAEGDKQVAIPLDKLEMRGDTLTAPKAASSRGEFGSQSQYKQDDYQRVTAGQRIDRSEFSAFEPQSGTGQRSLQQGSGMQQDGGRQQEGRPSGTRY